MSYLNTPMTLLKKQHYVQTTATIIVNGAYKYEHIADALWGFIIGCPSLKGLPIWLHY